MFREWHHAVPESAYFEVPETLKTFRMYSISRYAPCATRGDYHAVGLGVESIMIIIVNNSHIDLEFVIFSTLLTINSILFYYIHVIGGLPGFLFTGINASLKDCLAGVSGFKRIRCLSDGPIHVIKYSNSIQEINWLYSLLASVIPGVSTRSLDRTKLIVYTTSLPLFIKDSNIACM